MLPRRRKANNLAQSLGRMAHVKSNTVTWLKSFEKQVMRDVPVAIHMYTTPPADSMRPVATSGAVIVSSPLSSWPLHDGVTLAQVNVQVTCSFCSKPIHGETYTVHYNFLLPSPYVLACAECSEKTSQCK